jgi:hypothetical protein
MWLQSLDSKAAAYIRDYKGDLEHPKLLAREEACIFPSLGHSEGYKGLVCSEPENIHAAANT